MCRARMRMCCASPRVPHVGQTMVGNLSVSGGDGGQLGSSVSMMKRWDCAAIYAHLVEGASWSFKDDSLTSKLMGLDESGHSETHPEWCQPGYLIQTICRLSLESTFDARCHDAEFGDLCPTTIHMRIAHQARFPSQRSRTEGLAPTS